MLNIIIIISSSRIIIIIINNIITWGNTSVRRYSSGGLYDSA
jgi:hypothetical protein